MTVPRDVPAIIGTRHLVVKFVHILETTFPRDEHAPVRRLAATSPTPRELPRAPRRGQRAPAIRDAGGHRDRPRRSPTSSRATRKATRSSSRPTSPSSSFAGVAPSRARGEKERRRRSPRERRSRGYRRGRRPAGGAAAHELTARPRTPPRATTTPPMGASFERPSAALEWLAPPTRSTRTGGATISPRDGADACRGRFVAMPDPGAGASRTWTVWRRSGRNCSRRSTTMRRLRRTEPSRPRLRAAASAVARERAGEIGAPSLRPAAAERWCTATLSSPTSSFRPSPRCATRAMDASGAATDVVDDRGRRRGASALRARPRGDRLAVRWDPRGGAGALYFFATSPLARRAAPRGRVTRQVPRAARRGPPREGRGWDGGGAPITTSIASLRDIDGVDGLRPGSRWGPSWGEVTSSPWRATPPLNVGMHRRSLPHLHVWRTRRAAKGLDALECERPGATRPRRTPTRARRSGRRRTPRGAADRRATRRRTPRDVRLPRGRGGGYRSRRRRERTPRRRRDKSGARARRGEIARRATRQEAAGRRRPRRRRGGSSDAGGPSRRTTDLSALRRTFGVGRPRGGRGIIRGGVGGEGRTNADGTVDAVDAEGVRRRRSAPPREEATGSVRAWEILLPRASNIWLAPRAPPDCARPKSLFDEPRAACARSDVDVWLDPLEHAQVGEGPRTLVRGHHAHRRLRRRAFPSPG